MPILARGQTVDCSTETKLDIFTSIGGVLTDVSSMEWAIFDITDELNPIQVEPGTGRNSLNVVDPCPTGDRISVGHYALTWTVPDLQTLGNHEVRWWFRLTPTSPEEFHEEQFQVLTVSGAGDSDALDVAEFRVRFPQFDGVSSEIITRALQQSQERVRTDCLATVYNDAVHLLAAHIVELSVGGLAKGIASVSADGVSVSYTQLTSTGGGFSYNSTPYGRQYLELIQRCGPGIRVLC